MLLCFVASVSVRGEDSFKPDDVGFRAAAVPFLKAHCLRCHGQDQDEGEFRIDRDLTANFADLATNEKWNEVVNVLNSHEMPPEMEPQPSTDEVAKIVDWITEQVGRTSEFNRDTSIVLRRMNRSEYQNVIRDLVQLVYDTKHFPQDPPAGGFDNNGGALNLSPMQLEQYYDSAMDILDEALVTGPKPEMVNFRIEPETGDGDHNRVKFLNQNPIVNGGKNPVRDGCVVMHHANWDRSVNSRDFALPTAGKYRITIRAGNIIPTREQVVDCAETFLRRRMDEQIAQQPQGAKYIREEFESAMQHFKTDRMYDYGPPRLKVIRDIGGQPMVIAELDIDASKDSMKEFVIETEYTTQKAGITLEYAYDIPRELENFWFQTGDGFARPEAWIDYIELKGPIHDVWPPKSHVAIMLDDDEHKSSDTKHAEKVIRNFMLYAYRRSVSEQEVGEKLDLFKRAAKDSKSFIEAIKAPLSAVLISPHFLFLTETTKFDQRLQDFELANRLSYFLWSSMPDKTLLSLAFEKKLQDPEVLKVQLDRMLLDERSEAFVANFGGQWLGLREVGANPPAADLYRQYDRHLETSMVEESKAFLREILHNDLSVMNFIDSDFVVINERLARFYGIDNVRGDHFRKVSVPKGVERGGVMTQASVLTITSNGTRTSPVKRGTWVLKNILGTDPGLPVTNAGEIAPKVPGIDRATVRQRLEIHRELPQCARCHNKIDPLGFALENYDASGNYRVKEGFGYQGRVQNDDPKIDASSKLPDGTVIRGISSLKKALVQKEDLLMNCLAHKMFTYALGRELTLADEPTIKEAVNAMKSEGKTCRSLMKSIVLSDLFRNR